MNYINCPSYDPLFFALYLKDKGEDIFIITRNQDVEKYCIFKGILHIKLTQPILSFKKLFSLTLFKIDVSLFFQDKKIKSKDKYYFFGNEHTIEGFYLAKLFSKKCKVLNPMILNFSFYKRSLFTLNSIKHLIGKKIFKWRLGIDLILKDWKTHPVYGIDNNFIDKYKIIRFDFKNYFQKIKKEVIQNNQIKQKEYDNLYDGGILLNEGVIKKESLKKLSEFLLSQNNFVVKDHPFFKHHLNYFKNCEKYPPYIPIEFLFRNIKKNFVAVYCQALKVASQMENIRAISLIELVEFEDNDFKQKVKEILLEGTPGIIFPKTYGELGELLK